MKRSRRTRALAFSMEKPVASAASGNGPSRRFTAGADPLRKEGRPPNRGLAFLKLSSVWANRGNADEAAKAADSANALLPADADAMRLRVEGNLAIAPNLACPTYRGSCVGMRANRK